MSISFYVSMLKSYIYTKENIIITTFTNLYKYPRLLYTEAILVKVLSLTIFSGPEKLPGV